jgi:6-phosphogluconate dehydrogenase (decarboxylating)
MPIKCADFIQARKLWLMLVPAELGTVDILINMQNHWTTMSEDDKVIDSG